MKNKIISILLIAIIILGITGCGSNKQEERDWKDKYYNYLLSLEEKNPVKVHKVGFIKSVVSDIPIMYVLEENTDEKENNKGISYYWINDDKVTFLHKSLGNDYPVIKYLFNVEKQKYYYYEVSEINDGKLYGMLEKYIQSWTEYKDKEDFGDVSFEVLKDGIVKSNDLVKKHIDDVLIETDIEENVFEFEKDNEKFRANIDNIKEEKNLVTEEVNEKIEKELDRINNNSKTSNDNNSDGIKAGNYTISYGTYTSSVDKSLGMYGGEYIIKSDGTFTYKNTWTDYDGNSFNNTASGTYEVKYENIEYMPGSPENMQWVITFTATNYKGKGKFEEQTNPNDTYYNVDSYTITGNNKFQAEQYENVWTLVK